MRKICNRSTAVSAGRRGGTRNTKKIRGKKKRVAITAEAGQLRTNKTREREFSGRERRRGRGKRRIRDRATPGGEKRGKEKT